MCAGPCANAFQLCNLKMNRVHNTCACLYRCIYVCVCVSVRVFLLPTFHPVHHLACAPFAHWLHHQRHRGNFALTLRCAQAVALPPEQGSVRRVHLPPSSTPLPLKFPPQPGDYFFFFFYFVPLWSWSRCLSISPVSSPVNAVEPSVRDSPGVCAAESGTFPCSSRSDLCRLSLFLFSPFFPVR